MSGAPDQKSSGPLEIEHDEKSVKGEAAVSGDCSGAAEKIDPIEIALVRKLDRRIMPVLWAMYFLDHKLDRNALPQARLNTLEEDPGLKGVDYNTATSILHLQTFHPGALYLLSIFYTRKELATRISVLYTGQVVSTECSGLIAAATFATLDKVKGIAGWQWLFIIEGSVTALVAILGFFLLPDDPSETRWLTAAERKLAVDRHRRDTVGQQERGSTWDGLKQACKDPKTGFRSTTALLLTAPPYFVSGILGIPFAWSSGRLNERTWHITAGLGLAIVGFAMSCGTTNNAVRYASTFLYATGAYSVGSVILGWVSNTLSQTPEKKAVAYSPVNVTANLAYIYCANLWPSTDGPRYMMGFSSMFAFAAASIACAWAMRVWLVKINRRIRESDDENVKLYAY
ncbi:putative transporter [Colletotrichum spinosum]|uniref:Putative transporter n=1 Tax=Colletotrichum spinosum TaxID=1347390 RepID=A0A4R8QQN1_9PEZI|nr:putative transporter [Colletotrichum spinosum]